MKTLLSLLFISSLFFTSCKKEVETENIATPTNVVPFTEVGKQLQTKTPVTQNSVTTASDNIATNAVAASMNPAHGKPGHRCDIEVGAPLNSPVPASLSKPAASQVITQQNQPVATAAPIVAPAVATPTAPGMNPPHGQTNHRCDIAVGAPLPK